MVKGINKSVIEINDTENCYIERAILFVNPKFIDRDSRTVVSQAKNYLKGLTLPDYCTKAKRRAKLSKTAKYACAVKILSLACLSLTAALVITMIIH